MYNLAVSVCIIEDTPDHLDVLRWSLEESFVLTSFISPCTALSELSALKPDVFLIDLGMPEMDGIECLERSANCPGWPTPLRLP